MSKTSRERERERERGKGKESLDQRKHFTLSKPADSEGFEIYK